MQLSRVMPLIQQKCRHVARVVALAPYFFHPPSRCIAKLRAMCHVTFLNGIEGFKDFVRQMEAQASQRTLSQRATSWTQRQLSRCRRMLALLPVFADSPGRAWYLFRELSRVFLFHGFVGLKKYCGVLEARQRLARNNSHVHPANVNLGYVITAPPFISNSAGIYCLYRLCHELNRQGFPSYIVGSNQTSPDLDAPLIGQIEAKELCRQGYRAVYPETIHGNPLEAVCVARWVLNRPGLLGGDEVYAATEHVFCYSEVFHPYIKNKVAGKLYLPTIDETIFYCDDWDVSKRNLECFYVGKSQWKDGFVDRASAFEVTRETPSKKELGKLLRASRVLYCFDNSTILVYEALMCGCPVVIIPDGSHSKDDYQTLELGCDGIAWGLAERDQLKVDGAGLRRRYENVKRDFYRQLANFIDVTQERYGIRLADSLRIDPPMKRTRPALPLAETVGPDRRAN